MSATTPRVFEWRCPFCHGYFVLAQLWLHMRTEHDWVRSEQNGARNRRRS